MARSPQLDAKTYEHLLGVARARGYTLDKLQKVPQEW